MDGLSLHAAVRCGADDRKTLAPADVAAGVHAVADCNAAYSRCDPVFLVSDGTEQRPVPVQRNAFSVTGGVGSDFPLAAHWTLRAMLSFTWSHVTSDLEVARWWLGSITDADADLELRYTHVKPRNSGPYADMIVGRASAEIASIWARRGVPTGWVVWERPVYCVLEGAFTRFLCSQKEVGVDRTASVCAFGGWVPEDLVAAAAESFWNPEAALSPHPGE